MVVSEKKGLREANLEEIDLIGANLQVANFQGANPPKWIYFIRANFKEAKLEGAVLEGANLVGVQHLSLYQLSKVKTLHAAKLDEELRIPLKEKYPALFEETR